MRELSHEKRKLSKRWVIHRIQMLASLATIMKEKTALVTSMVYFALTKFDVNFRFFYTLSPRIAYIQYVMDKNEPFL